MRQLVTLIERVSLPCWLSTVSPPTQNRSAWVYVDGHKIAALGLRVRRGCSFHGLSLNVDMDLEPFLRINPCGHAGLAVTQLVDLGGAIRPGQDRATVGTTY